MSDGQTPRRDLAATMQALYDNQINFTLTMLWDGGFDFALVSYMDFDKVATEDWQNVATVAELADALHFTALKKYPESRYALSNA